MVGHKVIQLEQGIQYDGDGGAGVFTFSNTLLRYGLFENMELAITKIGIDAGIGKMAATGMRRLELRSVQSVQQVDGESKNQSIKVFATGLSNKIPGGSLEIGSAIENEMTYSLKRYQIFVDGEELVCIDRLGECRIMGKPITSGIESLL